MKRRDFIKASMATMGALVLPSEAALAASRRPKLTGVSLVEALPSDQQRHWLGSAFWGNRLQDWQVANGRIECLRNEEKFDVRTCSVLSRELNAKHEPARVRVQLGQINPGKKGFGGLLLGGGAGELDYRGAALIQHCAGVNGGFMAVIDHTGKLSFKNFSNVATPLKFEELQREGSVELGDLASRNIVLDCHIDPVPNGLFDVRLIAIDADSNEELGFIVRTGVAAKELQGNIMLVSSPDRAGDGARWWFNDVATGGGKITADESHTLGPVMGCMYSLNQSVVKLTAQFMPVDLSQFARARLDIKPAGSKRWQKGPEAALEEGFVARYRLADWNSSKDAEYRICFAGSEDALFTGTIVKDPGKADELKVALYSCILPTSRSLDDPFHKQLVPEERVLGRYTDDVILFPHTELVGNCDSHKPDLYVFCGDQYYETYPTRYGRETVDAKLDTLYRWYLWYWTYRESVRNRPSVMLADDHDILQGNLWGNAGENGGPKEEDGGYKYGIELVRMVYRMQHGHNPDAYDPTPIKHDIPVSYGNFIYGGVNFALVEDRKWKSPPDYKANPKTKTGELLGKRQEDFLAKWKDMQPELPKILIAASIWGSPQTEKNGKPLIDFDANGYPFDGRTRAVRLARDANALVLAGDQHLGMVARQGVDDFDDGPLFFAGPAAAAFWQRWFEGWGKLDGQRNGDPNTGNFVDTFGNKMRVLAVANPQLTYDQFVDDKKGWGMFLADKKLKSEGYGLIRVDHKKQQYALECWPWDADPAEGGQQFAGWPVNCDFKKAGKA